MTRYLITGHAGFVGGYVRKRLTSADDWMGIDRKTGNDVRAIVVADIHEFDPEVVIHLAAEHYVPWCRDHPKETLSTNVSGTKTLLDSLYWLRSLRTVVLASSAAVYGFGDRWFSEDDDLNPVDIYGESKVMAETVLAEFAGRRPTVACIAARLSNVIGPGDRTDHLAPKIAAATKTDRLKLGNLWPKRDYIHAADVAEALMRLGDAPPGFGVYNVSTGVGTSPVELLVLFEQVRQYPLQIDQVEGRELDGHLVLNPRLIRHDIGFVARTTVREAVEAWRR